MSWEFWAGVAVGAIISLIMLALAQARGAVDLQKVFAAEDKVDEQAKEKHDVIEKTRQDAHAAIDQLTPDELDRVLNGTATVDECLRERTPPLGIRQPGKPTS